MERSIEQIVENNQSISHPKFVPIIILNNVKNKK
jgi:hypothetical protein